MNNEQSIPAGNPDLFHFCFCLVPLQMIYNVKHLHFKATNDGDQFSLILTCFVRIVLPPW